MSRQVFLSYKSTEYGIADEIRAHLRANGLSVWMAPDDIRGGQSYADQIPKAIKGCTAFVIVLSDASMHSIWCAREVDRALNEGKRVMPFMIEDVELTDEYNFYLTNVQRYPAYKGFNAELERMTADIKKLTDAAADEWNGSVVAEQQAELEKEKEAQNEADAQRSDAPPEKAPGEKQPETVTPAQTETEPEPGKKGKRAREKTPPAEKKEKPKKEKSPKPERKKPEKPENADEPDKRKRLKKTLLFGLAGLLLLGAAILIAKLTANKPITICGKQYRENEIFLSIDGQELTGEDVAAIGRLKSLTEVSLTNCSIRSLDLSPLIGPNVTILELGGCGLTEAQFRSMSLAGSRVKSLGVAGASISDESLIAKLKDQLVSLDISGTKLSLDAVAGMKKLETLIADDIQYSSLSPLASLNELRRLSLRNNELTDISALSGLSQLTYLDLGDNEIRDLAPLTALLRMSELCLSDNTFTSLNGLENMTVLSVVDLSNNSITDISTLSKSAATLKRLYLGGTSVESLEPLAACRELTVLNINATKVSSLDAICGLPKLETLSARNTRLGGYAAQAPLSGGKLKYLDLRGSGVYSLSPDGAALMNANSSQILLSGTKLKHFDLGGVTCNCCDLSGLKLDYGSIDKLLTASIRCLIVDYSLLDGRLTELKDSKAGWEKVYLVDCPLDKQLAAEQALGSNRAVFITASEASKYVPAPPESVNGK